MLLVQRVTQLWRKLLPLHTERARVKQSGTCEQGGGRVKIWMGYDTTQSFVHNRSITVQIWYLVGWKPVSSVLFTLEVNSRSFRTCFTDQWILLFKVLAIFKHWFCEQKCVLRLLFAMWCTYFPFQFKLQPPKCKVFHGTVLYLYYSGKLLSLYQLLMSYYCMFLITRDFWKFGVWLLSDYPWTVNEALNVLLEII